MWQQQSEPVEFRYRGQINFLWLTSLDFTAARTRFSGPSPSQLCMLVRRYCTKPDLILFLEMYMNIFTFTIHADFLENFAIFHLLNFAKVAQSKYLALCFSQISIVFHYTHIFRACVTKICEFSFGKVCILADLEWFSE